MKEAIRIIKKEGPIEETVDCKELVNKRVISLRGLVVGRIKGIRMNPTKLFIEGIIVSRGLFNSSLYIGSSYFSKVSQESIMLSIDPFVFLKGMKVLTDEGEKVGKVRDILRKNNTNDISVLVVKHIFRKDTNIEFQNIKSVGNSIILKSNYNVTKKYIWQGS